MLCQKFYMLCKIRQHMNCNVFSDAPNVAVATNSLRLITTGFLCQSPHRAPIFAFWLCNCPGTCFSFFSPFLELGSQSPLTAGLAVKPLFFASTVSALHRNAHIWNASHTLLVTYYCWVTVYSPSMEAKKLRKYVSESGNRTGAEQKYSLYIGQLCYSIYPMGRTVHENNADLFKVQITTFAENGKNSVNAEKNESFTYMLFKLYVQV